MMKIDRISWVDNAKGIGIILVIFGHTLRGLRSSGIVADGLVFNFVDSWIYSFHMPLFFLLSGLFAERRLERGAGEFFRDKMSTLAYPYFLWSTLQTLLQSAVGRYTNHQIGLHELARILTHPIMQFWFLYALFVISLIYYLVRRCGLSPLGALLSFALLCCTRGWIILWDWPPLLAARSHGFYYALGSVIDGYGITRRLDRSSTMAMFLIVILGYGIVTTAVSRPQEVIMLIALAVSLSGIAASIALAVLVSRVGSLDFVRILGTYSLEIYVAHTIASAALRIVLQKIFQVQDATIHLVIGTAGGIVLPLLLALLSRRYHAEFLFRFPRLRISGRK